MLIGTIERTQGLTEAVWSKSRRHSQMGATIAVDLAIGRRIAHRTHKLTYRCLSHSTGNLLISADRLISTGCRPSRIASTISGASNVNRRISPT